jgi:nucleotide-binding universal stress UspA family protein
MDRRAPLTLRWAAREAWARGTTLTVCLAWTPDHLKLPGEPALADLARQHGQEILARGLPYAESVLAPDRTRADLAAGSAARVLCERSRAAEMVVVGSHGHGELPGLRLGSVSWQMAGARLRAGGRGPRRVAARQPAARSGRAGRGRLSGRPGRHRLCLRGGRAA